MRMPTNNRKRLCQICNMLVAMPLVLNLSINGVADEVVAGKQKTFPGATLFNEQPPFLAGVLVNHADGRYQAGDLLSITFQSEESAYLYLLYHQADDNSALLFPNPAVKDSFIVRGQKVQIPSDDQSFRFRIQAPFGEEVLQVIASTKQLSELDALRTSASGAPSVSRDILTKLAVRLGNEPQTWTEHRVRIQTEPKPIKLPSTPPTPPAQRFGLFIGIGKYQHPELAATHIELENSARVLHRHMLATGGITPERSRLLINEQATKIAMEESITQWLPHVTKPGDLVFVYFSGHAGQFDTDSPAEPDGKDEALCPYDLDAGTAQQSLAERLARAQQSSILDDTFARWLQELCGRQVVVILDTCHGGGFVTGKGQTLKANLLFDEAARVKDISQLNVIVMASCAADEQSQFEGTSDQTMWFTHCLVELFEKPGKHPVFVHEAYEYTRQRMQQLLRQANAGREQEPTFIDTALLPIQLIP
ncbi:MAG: caspase family protein [Pirellulaceae bacterium]|nr:caspase family protein [Pirellulaceae bacterium]